MRIILFTMIVLFALPMLGAAELNFRMPFKPGRNSAIAWWDAPKGQLFEEEGKKLLTIEAGSGMRFKNHFQAEAGDVLEFVLTMKCEKGPVSIRLGQHSRHGWIGERVALITETNANFAVYQGEIILQDAIEPDKDGILRRVSEFSFSVYAHPDARNLVVENVKAILKTKEKQP